MKNKRDEELKLFREALDKTEQKDFNGHTDFKKLTAKQKIKWLDELNEFKQLRKNKNSK